MACSCLSRAGGRLRLVHVGAALHLSSPALAAAGAQGGGKCSVPLLFPGDADGEAQLLPAAGALLVPPLEILKGLGLRIIYSYAGKGAFTFPSFCASCFSYGSLDQSFDSLFAFSGQWKRIHPLI